MTTQKDTTGVGFVGAGDVAVLHAAAVKKCPGAKLVGLWNRSQDRDTRSTFTPVCTGRSNFAAYDSR